MTVIHLSTYIKADINTCFNLARDIDMHVRSTAKTKENAIAGRTNGLIEKGETVTWEAVHFGIKQQLTTLITEMEPPVFFSDTMLKGAFKSLYHEHRFKSEREGTVMDDILRYETPFGILGKIFDQLFLKRHMTKFLLQRNALIKQEAIKKLPA